MKPGDDYQVAITPSLRMNGEELYMEEAGDSTHVHLEDSSESRSAGDGVGIGDSVSSLTFYLDMDMKKLNESIWFRVHQYLLRESAFTIFILQATLFLLLTPAIVTAVSAKLRCWTGDGCLRHWNGAAAILAVYGGNVVEFLSMNV